MTVAEQCQIIQATVVLLDRETVGDVIIIDGSTVFIVTPYETQRHSRKTVLLKTSFPRYPHQQCSMSAMNM